MPDYKELEVRVMVVEFDVKERDGKKTVRRVVRAVPPSTDPAKVAVFMKRKLAELIEQGLEVERARIDVVTIPLLVSEEVARAAAEEGGE